MTARIEATVADVADRWRARIADRLRALTGVTVAEEGGGIVASGKRLRARWLRDARLRWLGGWM